MAKSDEKWVMFKQFMYNELGISKADIQDWIQDAVKCEIERRLNDTYDHFSLKDMIGKEIKNKVNSTWVTSDIVREIASNYKIVKK